MSNLALKIITSEKGQEIYLQKVQKEIIKINENKNLFKINNLTIMLLGKSGVGKSTLINNFLKLEGNQLEQKARNINLYQSEFIPLRLIDTKGFDLNQDYGPKALKKDIDNFILEQLSSNDINNFVNCIWFCITGDKLEKAEIDLLNHLNNSHKNIPIIIVYVQATDEEKIIEMDKYIKENNIDENSIKVLAFRKKLINGTILESYGLSELLVETLDKCRNSLKSDMFSVMDNNISNEIKNVLKKENINIKIIIRENIIINFIKEYIVKNDEDFEKYIIDIYGQNIKYFFNKDMNHNSITLFKESQLINNHKNNYVNFYKNKTNSIISNDTSNLAYKFLDLQTIKEKESGNTLKMENRRTHKDFIDSTTKFLNDNFYYLAQKYYISYIIQNICNLLSESFEDNLNDIINKLMNQNDVKTSKNNCLLIKFNQFEESIKPCFFNMNDLNNGNNFNNNEIDNLNQQNDEIDLPTYTEIHVFNKKVLNQMNINVNLNNNNATNNMNKNINNNMNSNINNNMKNNKNNNKNNNKKNNMKNNMNKNMNNNMNNIANNNMKNNMNNNMKNNMNNNMNNNINNMNNNKMNNFNNINNNMNNFNNINNNMNNNIHYNMNNIINNNIANNMNNNIFKMNNMNNGMINFNNFNNHN